MKFNPEDGQDFGPHCRNCHKGSSACGTCHGIEGAQGTTPAGWTAGYARFTTDTAQAIDNSTDYSILDVAYTTTGLDNEVAQTVAHGFFKQSRTVDWTTDWRTTTTDLGDVGDVSGTCSDNGFSWPHRTMGWKMLKDDLFGLDVDGDEVDVGTARDASVGGGAAHDLDSVCLDCHNPTVWNATDADHTDGAGTADDYNDELLLRGLP